MVVTVGGGGGGEKVGDGVAEDNCQHDYRPWLE